MRPISRRKAIKTGIATATAAIFTEVFPKSLWAKPLVTSSGIQLYTVDKELKADVEGTLKKVKAIGYEEVEAAGFAGLSAKQFRVALDGAGLKCASTHFFNFGGSDPGPLFEQANALGVHYTVSSMMGNFPNKPSGSEMGVEGYKALAEYCNQLGEKAKQAGLQFAFHNHNTEFKDLGRGKVGYDVLVEATDPNLVKLELDCGWMVAAGHNPIDYFKRYPNRYRMVHIKDFVRPAQPSTSLKRDEVPQGTVLGTGYIKYKPILLAAKAAGVEHCYVEQEPPFIGTTAFEAATKDYEYIRSLSI
ncbi:sugar phosphate isomerase/epimerase family protein [Edaphobacter aggregans]|uniref:sugar phosphate isomerase/epimerase family protein n=1 Tax=Edaphobacter aggregans TaxID=570835 RepID=UPI00068E99FE|nr:sugar phosphate isomerase/epimerase [Edaphobacter aggregans]